MKICEVIQEWSKVFLLMLVAFFGTQVMADPVTVDDSEGYEDFQNDETEGADEAETGGSEDNSEEVLDN